MTATDWRSVAQAIEARTPATRGDQRDIRTAVARALEGSARARGAGNVWRATVRRRVSVMKVFNVPERGPNTERPNPRFAAPSSA